MWTILSLLLIIKIPFTAIARFVRPPTEPDEDLLGTCKGCWCIPSAGPNGDCPDLGDVSKLPYSILIQRTFSSHKLLLTPYEELPHLIPKGAESGSFLQCQPYKSILTEDPRPACKDYAESSVEDSVCAFVYETLYQGRFRHKRNRKYGMYTYETKEEALQKGAVITHHGACGVCSNANDLAIYMDTSLQQQATVCGIENISNFNDIFDCMKNQIGFTDECAYLWANDVLASVKNCFAQCLPLWNDPTINPTDPETCQMNDCLQCNEDSNGDIFRRFSGRTRRNSGIRTLVVRECSSMADIVHDPWAGPIRKRQGDKRFKRRKRKYVNWWESTKWEKSTSSKKWKTNRRTKTKSKH